MLFNRVRALEYMDRCGLDALIATSPVNITYFTDYFCWLDPLFRAYMTSPGAPSTLFQRYTVFPRQGEPALVVDPLLAVNAADVWVRDLYTFGDAGLDAGLPSDQLDDIGRRFVDVNARQPKAADSTAALLDILRARGLTDARLGLEMEGVTPQARAAIIGALPGAQIRDCSNLIRLLRAVKTDDELARLTRAAEINELAAMESLAMARPGRALAEMAQHYRVRAAGLGADFDHYAFGMRGVGIATEPDYRLSDGEVLYVDFGCIYRRCFSDSGTTLALRTPSADMLRRHAALRSCLDAAVGQIRPGVRASQVRAAMWQALNAGGITASHPHGHGLGLEVRDYPIIVPDNGLHIRDECIDVPSDLPLEANMVINLESVNFLPGIGSLHIEKSFVVTETGCRALVEQDRSGPFIPA
jgi:Xaa-Pro dipeptidase